MAACHPCFSGVVLAISDIAGVVATFLCLRQPAHRDTDDSLLQLALCCRGAHTLVMRDGRWWRQRTIVVNMHEPLVVLHMWCCVSLEDAALAVQVESVGARQQAVLRQLLGGEVYEREVAPRLTEVRTVKRGPYSWAAVWLSNRPRRVLDQYLPHSRTFHGAQVQVYPQLTPALFDRLFAHLPALRRCRLIDDAPRDKSGHRHNEPYCQWLLGRVDAALLPKYVQWTAHATISIKERQPPQPCQRESLLYTLQHMPGVTQLSLLLSEDSTFNFDSSSLSMSLPELTSVLPKLVSLSVRRLPLQSDVSQSLLLSSPLQHLRLDDILVNGGAGHWFLPQMPFEYPLQWPPEPVQQSGVGVDDRNASRANRRLRLALCAHWERILDQQPVAEQQWYRASKLHQQFEQARRQLQEEERQQENDADVRLP